MPVPTTDDNAVLGIEFTRTGGIGIGEFKDGRAVGCETDEFGGDFGIFAFAFVCAEGESGLLC